MIFHGNMRIIWSDISQVNFKSVHCTSSNTIKKPGSYQTNRLNNMNIFILKEVQMYCINSLFKE